MNFALATKKAGARRFGLVSSVGADANSRFLYPRTKGEAERAVLGLGFESVVIVRPSFLIGERGEPRPAERLGIAIARAVGPALLGPLRRWRAVPAETVAAALVGALRGRVPGSLILESENLRAS